MKTRALFAIVSASLLALGAVAWAADQNQTPTNDQSPAYNQTTPGNNYQGGMAYDYRGQYAQSYGCGWGGPVYQERVSNTAPSGNSRQGFWRGCGRWFGRMNPWHYTQDRAAYSGCCR